MILGIICLILLIIGSLIYIHGEDEGNLLIETIGLASMVIGFIGVVVFIGINIDTIKIWFKI